MLLQGKKLWFFVIMFLITLVVAITFIILYATKSTTTPVPTTMEKSALNAELHKLNISRQLKAIRAADAETLLFTPNPFDKIDRIYYINMDNRPDRKYQLETELKSMNVPWHKVHRIAGVVAKNGALGCSKAHLNALKDFANHDYQTVLILEDDFMFKQGREEVFSQLSKFWNLNLIWDVVLFSSYSLQYEPTYVDFLIRLIDAQTASGYMVNRAFLPKLLSNFETGLELLERDPTNGSFCVDQYWKLLQPSHNWYTFHPVMAHQRPGYSDIEKTNVDYLDKNDIILPETKSVPYIISILSCLPRLKKSQKQIAALNLLLKNHNIQYFIYYGDPNLSKEFELNLSDSTVCVRDKDDYLNLSHKIGQMIHFLKNYKNINNSCSDVKGFLFIDDDLDIFTDKFFQFLEDRHTESYWGNTFKHHSEYSDHLKTKNQQSTLIKNTLLKYPELLKYPIKVSTDVTYCSGGCFYLKNNTLTQLSNLTYAFKPFPETAADLEFHKKIDPKTGQTYFADLSVFSDIDIGSALHDIQITAVHAPIKEIVYWEGL